MRIYSSPITCPINSSNVTLEISYSNHSAWSPLQNCSLAPCTSVLLSVSFNCSSTTIVCFDYHTVDNTSYCAPAVSCSIMEPCDVNGQCSLLTSVCVTNTCCSPSTLCLPLEWTHLCHSSLPSISELPVLYMF